jgi:hypothetical protein
LSPNGTSLLWHETLSTTRKFPNPNKPVYVIFADAEGNEIERLPTSAYNWQLGARLHWIDNKRAVFNDYDVGSNCYIARLANPIGQLIGQLSMPVYDTHGDSDMAITVNFRRLAALRPDYGYFNLSPLQDDELGPCDDDGLWKVPLDGRSPVLIISLKALAADTDPEAVHKINHPMFAPDGRHCIFLHRYSRGGVRWDRLILINLESGIWKVLADTGMASHFCWRSSEEVFGYLRGPDGEDGFFLIDLNGSMQAVAPGLLNMWGDGHPSIRGSAVLIDSYPDKARLQHLMLADIDVLKSAGSDGIQELGLFFHGFHYKGVSRCDLHPRFGASKEDIFLDSVWEGRRRLWRLRLDRTSPGAAPVP